MEAEVVVEEVVVVEEEVSVEGVVQGVAEVLLEAVAVLVASGAEEDFRTPMCNIVSALLICVVILRSIGQKRIKI